MDIVTSKSNISVVWRLTLWIPPIRYIVCALRYWVHLVIAMVEFLLLSLVLEDLEPFSGSSPISESLDCPSKRGLSIAEDNLGLRVYSM